MAIETGIGWTNGTVNFTIGCAPAGPGCDGCYAFAWAYQKWDIVFEPGGERRETKSGFTEPLRWQNAHEKGVTHMKKKDHQVPVPVWVFACSLSDFFDKEWPAERRARAWAVIKRCNRLRWQLVTKRIGLVERYLPDDWNGGKGYEHVGIIATMVNQEEIDRDMPKLAKLKELGVTWIGLSIEPQIGRIRLGQWLKVLDWVICGGESKQVEIYRDPETRQIKKRPHKTRPFHLEWAEDLMLECRVAGVPFFLKQMGDNPHRYGGKISRDIFGEMGKDPSRWPQHLRVQQMPTIYDGRLN